MTEATTKRSRADFLNAAQTQHFRIGHAAELLELLGSTLGEGCQLTKQEQDAVGLHIEYLADLIREHNEALGDALSTLEG